MSLQDCLEKQRLISAATKTGISTVAVYPFPQPLHLTSRAHKGQNLTKCKMCDISLWQVEKLQWLSVWWSLGGIIGGAFLVCTLEYKDRGKENFGTQMPAQLVSHSPSSAEQVEKMRWSTGWVQDSLMRKREGCLWKQSKTIWSLFPSAGDVQPLREKQKTPLHTAAASEDKCLNNECTPPLPFS